MDLEGNSRGSGVFEREPLVRMHKGVAGWGLLLADGDPKGRGANQRLGLN